MGRTIIYIINNIIYTIISTLIGLPDDPSGGHKPLCHPPPPPRRPPPPIAPLPASPRRQTSHKPRPSVHRPVMLRKHAQTAQGLQAGHHLARRLGRKPAATRCLRHMTDVGCPLFGRADALTLDLAAATIVAISVATAAAAAAVAPIGPISAVVSPVGAAAAGHTPTAAPAPSAALAPSFVTAPALALVVGVAVADSGLHPHLRCA